MKLVPIIQVPIHEMFEIVEMRTFFFYFALPLDAIGAVFMSLVHLALISMLNLVKACRDFQLKLLVPSLLSESIYVIGKP